MDQNSEQALPQQSLPQSADVVLSHGNPMSKVLFAFIGAIILVFIAGGSYYLGMQHAIGTSSSANKQNGGYVAQKILQPTATPTLDPTADWLVYTNAKYGYSIKYPQDLKLNEQNTYYHYVEFKNPSATGQLPAYVVSVIPDTFVAKDQAAYNYMSADWINNINNLAIGETKTLDSAANFTRLSNILVDGQTATVIQVNATGYKQERVYVKEKNFIYMISNYYQTESELGNFNLFLSTFKLTQ